MGSAPSSACINRCSRLSAWPKRACIMADIRTASACWGLVSCMRLPCLERCSATLDGRINVGVLGADSRTIHRRDGPVICSPPTVGVAQFAASPTIKLEQGCTPSLFKSKFELSMLDRLDGLMLGTSAVREAENLLNVGACAVPATPTLIEPCFVAGSCLSMGGVLGASVRSLERCDGPITTSPPAVETAQSVDWTEMGDRPPGGRRSALSTITRGRDATFFEASRPHRSRWAARVPAAPTILWRDRDLGGLPRSLALAPRAQLPSRRPIESAGLRTTRPWAWCRAWRPTMRRCST